MVPLPACVRFLVTFLGVDHIHPAVLEHYLSGTSIDVAKKKTRPRDHATRTLSAKKSVRSLNFSNSISRSRKPASVYRTLCTSAFTASLDLPTGISIGTLFLYSTYSLCRLIANAWPSGISRRKRRVVEFVFEVHSDGSSTTDHATESSHAT